MSTGTFICEHKKFLIWVAGQYFRPSLFRQKHVGARGLPLLRRRLPYTHINLHTWARYVQRWGPSVSLALRPIFLGGVMKATGNKPPGLLASKMRFMSQDIGRACAMSEIPILPIPSNFVSEVAREVVHAERQPGGAALDDHHVARAVALTRGRYPERSSKRAPRHGSAPRRS